MSYQSHPELMGTGHVPGLDAVQIASAQRTQFGDMADLEVGGSLVLVHPRVMRMPCRPFLRMAVHPSEDRTVGYRMATSRDMQAFNSLDTVQPELPVAVTSPEGRPSLERGVHQEFSVRRKDWPRDDSGQLLSGQPEQCSGFGRRDSLVRAIWMAGLRIFLRLE